MGEDDTSQPAVQEQFSWIPAYMKLADRLLDFRQHRKALIPLLEQAFSGPVPVPSFSETDTFADGTRGFPRDIDPFSVFSAFNRGVTIPKRKGIFLQVTSLLGLNIEAPGDFDGIPIMNNMSSWFMRFEIGRGPTDIDDLWAIFAAAISHADSPTTATREAFIKAYDQAMTLEGIKWNLTFGLFWIRPHSYVALDQHNRHWITDKLDLPITTSGRKNAVPSGTEYLDLLSAVMEKAPQLGTGMRSLADFSHQAWMESREKESLGDDHTNKADRPPSRSLTPPPPTTPRPSSNPSQPYTLQTITDDGCFVAPDRLLDMRDRLEQKRNLILQGAPGTGKTWLAKRLGYALVGSTDPTLVRAVQFHPNISYEDFVCGYRPGGGNGRLTLIEGPFLEAAHTAHQAYATHGDSAPRIVLIIEEINRGNPAQIFGEMLTLMESTKRHPQAALRLTHQSPGEEPFWLPPNFFIIGTMNVADRSLAIVDFALRRRFSFVDLEPCFNHLWYHYVTLHRGMEPKLATAIQGTVSRLNETIASDKSLGPQFRIGHSFFTPGRKDAITNWPAWYRSVLDMDIRPLLLEYWFDSPERAEAEIQRLATLSA